MMCPPPPPDVPLLLCASVTGAPDAFATITQFLGPLSNPGLQTRQIIFTTETVNNRTRLKTMVYSGRTWTYSYDPSPTDGSRSLLKTVQPPVGQPWRFVYDTTSAVKNELLKVTTPYGGTIDYTYGTQGAGPGALASPFYLGSSIPVRSRVVTTRVTGGREVPPGAQAYKYAQGTARNQTIVEAPATCTASPSKTTYTFLGVGDNYQTGSRCGTSAC